MDWYLPIGQAVHEQDPGTLKEPAAHVLHPADGDALYLPAGQLLHPVEETALYLPHEHKLHAVEMAVAANLPAAHGVHEGALERLNVPEAQSEQYDIPAPANLPAGQPLQEAEEATSPYLPCGQLSQVSFAGAKEYLPLGQ
jgi:hypothetical protein